MSVARPTGQCGVLERSNGMTSMAGPSRATRYGTSIFRKGSLAAIFPDPRLRDDLVFEALSFIRCASDRVIVYSPPSGFYLEMPYQADAPVIYLASVPDETWVTGFAATGSKEI